MNDTKDIDALVARTVLVDNDARLARYHDGLYSHRFDYAYLGECVRTLDARRDIADIGKYRQ